MVLPSEAHSPAGHCRLHGHLFRGRRSGPRKTTCPRGHDLLIAANVYRDGSGQVRCRICKRERELAEERRQRELDARVCAWPGCETSLRGTRHSRKWCNEHREAAARAKVRAWHERKRQEEAEAAAA